MTLTVLIVLKYYLFEQQFEVPDSAVHCVIKYIGTEAQASQFKYKFQLGKVRQNKRVQ